MKKPKILRDQILLDMTMSNREADGFVSFPPPEAGEGIKGGGGFQLGGFGLDLSSNLCYYIE
ncbi:MAG: hypothetical protein ACWGOY_09570 [Anaerolineales bacterium]